MKAFGYAVALAILLQSGQTLAADVDPAPFVPSLDPAPEAPTKPPTSPQEANTAFAEHLKLRPDQRAAYDAWRATGAEDSAAEAADTEQRRRALDTTPHFYAYVQAHMSRDIEQARLRTTAMNAFYAVLTPQQRTIFDEAMLGPIRSPTPNLPIPTDDDPTVAPPDYHRPALTAPDWSQTPDGDVFAAFYPIRAQHEAVAGEASISCVVTRQGLANDCKVVSESPEGYGFGAATVEIAGFFRFRPATSYGVPVEGTITVPLKWALGPNKYDPPASTAVGKGTP